MIFIILQQAGISLNFTNAETVEGKVTTGVVVLELTEHPILKLNFNSLSSPDAESEESPGHFTLTLHRGLQSITLSVDESMVTNNNC